MNAGRDTNLTDDELIERIKRNMRIQCANPPSSDAATIARRANRPLFKLAEARGLDSNLVQDISE